jgi:two-component system chemotaxis response regulator CheY
MSRSGVRIFSGAPLKKRLRPFFYVLRPFFHLKEKSWNSFLSLLVYIITANFYYDVEFYLIVRFFIYALIWDTIKVGARRSVMIINSSEAAKSLLETLDSLKSQAGAWKAVYLQVPSLRSAKDMMSIQSAIQNMRKHTSEHYQSQVFFCDSGDVFILLKGASMSLVSKVHDIAFAILAGDKSSTPSKVFELGTQWSLLKEMATKIAKESKGSLVPESVSVDQRIDRILRRVDMDYMQNMLKGRADRKGVSILVAEDDDIMQQYVSAMLSDYTLIKAKIGEDVLVSYLLNAPDMVLLDIDLPQIDGHRLMQEIFKLDQEAFIVMMSGHTQLKHVKRSIDAGARGFVAKPFQEAKLRSSVEVCANLKDLYNLSGMM